MPPQGGGVVEDPTVTAKKEELMRFKQAQLSSWKKKMAEVKMSVKVKKLTEKMLRETRLRENERERERDHMICS